MASNRPQSNVSQPVVPNGPRHRILRIGVLLGGKIVEERLIREGTPVSIGQSMKNTFSVPIEGLPLEFTLFALDQGRYSLRFLTRWTAASATAATSRRSTRSRATAGRT